MMCGFDSAVCCRKPCIVRGLCKLILRLKEEEGKTVFSV